MNPRTPYIWFLLLGLPVLIFSSFFIAGASSRGFALTSLLNPGILMFLFLTLLGIWGIITGRPFVSLPKPIHFLAFISAVLCGLIVLAFAVVALSFSVNN